jgi:hypothetical protein
LLSSSPSGRGFERAAPRERNERAREWDMGRAATEDTQTVLRELLFLALNKLDILADTMVLAAHLAFGVALVSLIRLEMGAAECC